MNVVGVSTPDGSPVVPGVQGSVSVTFTLLNNNKPDLNNGAAVGCADANDVHRHVNTYIFNNQDKHIYTHTKSCR